MKSQKDKPIWGTRSRVRLHSVILCLFILISIAQNAKAQQVDAGSAPIDERSPLTAEQVVHYLVEMNNERREALHAYQGTRTYRVDYRGFTGSRSAEMIVTVNYLSPATKEFTVQSMTGSKLIVDKVFKKLLEAEKEALDEDMQRRTALCEDNYRFTLVRYERSASDAMYVLQVDPLTKDKFLYRGQIWVDAKDFAVVRLEAEPAKNPSFWTKKSEIVQAYRKVGDFWLPASNRSLSAIRLGGHAELTIDYQDYKIMAASPVGSPKLAKK